MATIHRDLDTAGSAHPKDADPPICHFLEMAGELRNRIYREVLRESNKIRVKQGGYERPALLQTCKQIRREGLPIFYYENSFAVDSNDFRADIVVKFKKFVSSMKPASEDSPLQFRKVAYDYDITSTEPKWSNMTQTMRYIRSKEFDPYTPGPSHYFTEGSRDVFDLALAAMIVQAKMLRDQPGELLEGVLGTFRPILALSDPRWMDD